MADRGAVFITKYALTTGIFECAVEECGDGMVRVIGARSPTYYHGEGREWHRTKEGAIARAEEMRIAKLVSLRKSIFKLERLEFK